MNRVREKAQWYCCLSLKSLVSTLAYRTTWEQLQHPPFSLEHTGTVRSELCGILMTSPSLLVVWIPMKIHSSPRLSYKWVNPFLKQWALHESHPLGIQYLSTSSNISHNIKLKECLCVLDFPRILTRIPPLYHSSDHPIDGKSLWLPL